MADLSLILNAPRCSRGIWLDLLPGEVRETIVRSACEGALSTTLASDSNETALHLAQSSPVQRGTVLSVLGYHMRGHVDDMQWCVKAWITLFGDDAQRISLTTRPWESARGDAFHCLFFAPRLRDVEICDYPAYLSPVTGLSLRTLSIDVQGDCPANELIAMLPKIAAEELRLNFNYSIGERPDPWEAIADSNVLAHCPNLRVLDVMCCRDRAAREGSIWSVICKVTSLRELIVDGEDEYTLDEVPETVLSYLSQLDSVSLSGMGTDLAALIGTSVKDVSTLFAESACRDVDVLALVSCKNLKQLALVLDIGVEYVLAKTLRELPDLELLNLTWEYGSMYIEPSHGEILNAVLAAPKLKELSLIDVSIRMSELTQILQALGTRLQTLVTSLCDQVETPLERLAEICRAAADYNPGLHTLETLDSQVSDYLEDEDLSSRFESGAATIRMLRWLEIKAPMLSTDDMVEKISRWMGDPGDGCARWTPCCQHALHD